VIRHLHKNFNVAGSPVLEPGTGTELIRTGCGTGTFKILRNETETFILINKALEPNKNF